MASATYDTDLGTYQFCGAPFFQDHIQLTLGERATKAWDNEDREEILGYVARVGIPVELKAAGRGHLARLEPGPEGVVVRRG